MNKSLVGRWMMLFLLLFSPLMVVMTAPFAFAAQGPQTFTLDGRIKQAGTTTPILDPSVRIEVHVMNPSRTCVLYAEEQFVNTQTSNGYFNIAVGSNIGAGKRIAGVDPGLAMATVFQNSSAMTGTNVAGQTCAGGLYTPTTRDSRYFRIFVTPSSTAVTDQLADIILDAVPTAMVAESAESVGGFGPADLLRVNTVGSQVLSQANLENVFTSSNYSVLTALLAGTSTLYNRPASNGTNVLPTIAAPTSPSAGQIWYNAGNVYYHDGSVTRTISTGSSTSVSAADGTAAAPTIGFASDPNTGWYLAGPDNLAASTGGVERARINENGNLGIGSSNPGARLTLGGDASATAWQAGGIGIRQNSTNYTDTSSSGTVAFNYVNAFGVPTLLASNPTTYTNASSFSMYPPVPGTNVTLTNSTALTINATALTGGGGVTNGYGLQVNAPTGATNNYAATFMGGNVGVGTVAPTSALHVEGVSPGNAGILYVKDNGTDDSRPHFVIEGNSSATGAWSGMDFMTSPSAGTAHKWRFVARHESASSNPGTFTLWQNDGTWRSRMSFAANGNMSVGPQTPTAALHLKAGTAAAGTAPLKLTQGVNLTTPEPGAIEFDGTSLFYTDSTNTRRTLGVAGAGITALTGDVTASGSGSVTATIPNDTVTFAKMQNIATQRILGRSTAAAGDIEELTLGAGLSLVAGVLNVSDTTDDDSFATLLGVCGNGFMPLKAGGVWTCVEARSDLVNDTVVLRGATGSFEGNQITANSLRLNNAGAYVSINTPAAANYTLTLPANDGTASGQVLTTDGSGVLTWTTPLTSGGTGLFADGTAAAPSISFTNDTNTGIYRVGADELGFAANGSQVANMTTTTFGLNGIGMAKLQNGIGAGAPTYTFSTNENTGMFRPGANQVAFSTNGTEKVRILADGKVGIGTTAPDTMLQVAGTIRVGDGAETCSGGNFTGGIRYNGGNLQFCNGTAWTTLGTGSGSGDFLANGSVPMTGTFKATNGSAANPSITFNSDQDTGIYGSGSNGLSLAASGLSVLDVSIAGLLVNLNAAVTSSTAGAYKLNGFAGDPTQATYAFSNDNNAGMYRAAADTVAFATDGAERLRIGATGNVGIGTTAPSEKLDVKGTLAISGATSGAVKFAVPAVAGSATYTWPAAAPASNMVLQSDNAGALSWVAQSAGGGGDFMADGSVAATDTLYLAYGALGTGGLSINGDPDTGMYSDAANVLKLRTSGVDRVTVGSAGATVESGMSGGPALTLRNTVASGQSSVMFRNNSSTQKGMIGWGNSSSTPARYADNLHIETSSTDPIVLLTNSAERMRIDATGNVGIGTTAPDTMLQVAGTIRVGDGAETCSGGNFTGGIRYNGGNLQFCNGTAWTTLGTGSGSGDFLANGTIPMTGPLQASTGSAGAPSITFDGDEDTGFFNYTGNGISLVSGGTERIHFAGNTVVSATGAGYSMVGASSALVPTYSFANDGDSGMFTAAANTLGFSTGASERMRIDGSGNVGIGTTAPSEKLDVKGTLAISGATSGAVKFAVPAAAGSATYTWPAAAPASNMVLQSDNTGALSWVAAGGGSGDFMANGSVAMTGDIVLAQGALGVGGLTFAGDADTGLYRTGGDQISIGAGGSQMVHIAPGGTTFVNGNVWANSDFITESRFVLEDGLGGSVGFVAPSGAGSTTYTWPISAPASNMVLQSDNTGALSWVAQSAGGSGDFLANGTIPMTGAFQAATGAAATPSITFDGDEDTGFFNYAGNGIAIATGGTERIRISGAQIQSQTSGSYQLSAGTSASSPTYTFQNDSNTGIYRAAADTIGFATGGGTRMTLDDYTLLLATGYGEGLRVDSGGGGYGLVQIASANGTPGRIRFANGQNTWAWDTAISRPSAGRILIDNNAGGAADLEVNGFVKVGTTSTLCPAAGAGSIRYNAGAMEFCDGASWTALGTGSGTGDFMADGSVDMTGGLKVIDGGTVLSPAIRPVSSADVGISFSGNDIFFSSAGDYVGAINIAGLDFQNRPINGANFIAHGGGAANLPDYRFVSDSNTGIFAPAADNLAISTNGVERIRVNNDGALLLRELASSPAHTASFGSLYVKTDGKLYYKDESGTEVELGAGGGGTGDFMADGSVDMTGQFKAVDGNNAAPGISFASNPDTGFTWVGGGQDQIGLVIDGTELGYFNSGTFSWSQQIHAYRYSATDNGSAATPAFEIGTSSGPGLFSPAADTLGFSTASTERMRISSTGNVGIGTTAPGKSLEVTQASSTSGTPAVIGFTNAGIGNASSFALNQSDMISAGNGRRMLAQAYSGIELRGTRQTSGYTAPPAGASTDASVTVYGGSGDTPDAFKVVNNAGSSTFMTVTGAGRVGIGTTAPTLAGLEVRTAVSGRSGFFTGGGTNGAVSLGGTTGAGAIQGFTNGGGDAPILLQSNGGGAATVGIGTGTAANVTTRLYVNGSIKIGDGGELCPAAGAGAIKWNGTAIQFCDGSTWANIGGAGGSGDFMADGSVAMTDTLVLAGGVLGTGGVSFNGDPDTGIISNTSNVVSIMSGNSESANFQTSVINLLRKTNFTDGTAALPALSFSADPNTGIYRPGTDMVAVSTNATEHLRILANGNVGIGTTNPLAKLHVTGDIFTNSSLNIGYAEDGKMMGFGDWTNYIAGDSNVHYVKIGTNNNERMRIIANGDVGIGTTAPTEKLDVNGNVRATSFISTSDQRLKRDITSVPGLEAIMRLNGVTWNWKDSGQADMGVIAQEVEKVFPQSVVTNAGTGYKAVKYDSLIAPLIESTKELYGMCLASEKRNDKQDREIASLKEENKQLKSEVEDLKKRMERIENLLLKSVK